MSNIGEHAAAFTEGILKVFDRESLIVSKDCLEMTSAKSLRDHPVRREGPHVYVAYAGQCPLYAGETGENVYTRFKLDGSGSHDRKEWYAEVTEVRFLPLTCSGKYYRRAVEAALIIGLRPREQV